MSKEFQFIQHFIYKLCYLQEVHRLCVCADSCWSVSFTHSGLWILMIVNKLIPITDVCFLVFHVFVQSKLLAVVASVICQNRCPTSCLFVSPSIIISSSNMIQNNSCCKTNLTIPDRKCHKRYCFEHLAPSGQRRHAGC